jgi:hypothetical protein
MPRKVAPIPKESLQNRVVKSLKKTSGKGPTKAFIGSRLPDSPLNKQSKTPALKARAAHSKVVIESQYKETTANREQARHLERSNNDKDAADMWAHGKQVRKLGFDGSVNKISALHTRMTSK